MTGNIPAFVIDYDNSSENPVLKWGFPESVKCTIILFDLVSEKYNS
jgi:hypothetical protein